MHPLSVFRISTLAVLACLLGSGCALLRPRDKHPPIPDAPQILKPVNTEFAQALAHFAQGLIHAQNDDAPERAAFHYLEAIRLDGHTSFLVQDTFARLLRARQIDAARSLIASQKAQHPSSSDPWLMEAALEIFLRAPGKAILALEKATALAPIRLEAYIDLSRLYSAEEEWAKAAETMERAIANVDSGEAVYAHLTQIYARWRTSIAKGSQTEAALRSAMQAHLRRTFDKFPQSSVQGRLLAGLYLEQSLIDEALAVYHRVVDAHPDEVPLRIHIAADMVKLLGGVQSARTALEPFTLRTPPDPLATYVAGLLAEEQKQPSSAKLLYEKAVHASPSDPVNAWKLIVLLIETGDTSTALHELDAALLRIPDHPLLIELKACLLVTENQPQEAWPLFQWLEKNHPLRETAFSKGRYHLLHTLAAFHQRDWISFTRTLRLAIEAEERTLDAVFQQTFASEIADAPELTHLLEELLPHFPKLAGLRLWLGALHGRSENHATAYAWFEEARQIAESETSQKRYLTPFLYFQLGANAEQSDRWDEAEKYLRIALEINPDHHISANYLAYSWAVRNIHLHEALELIEHALDADPDNAAYLDTRGWIYYRLGRLEEAEADIRLAIQLHDEDATLWDHLGDVLKAAGQHLDARDAWFKALEIDPDNTEIKNKLRAE